MHVITGTHLHALLAARNYSAQPPTFAIFRKHQKATVVGSLMIVRVLGFNAERQKHSDCYARNRSQHLARFWELAPTLQNCKPKLANSVLRDSEEKLHN
jgi:hypothetical protein